MREPTDILPDEIAQFLRAETRDGCEDSWRAFLARHNRLLLRVAHLATPNREDAMDAYATLLERLREDDWRRLRAYSADGRSKFTTWLVVVTRRICVDFVRQKYGRYGEPANGKATRQARRSLNQLLGTTDLAAIPDDGSSSPEALVRQHELRSHLHRAKGELNADDRLLLRLRFDDDLSASEIARLVGYSTPFHVYRRVNALLTQLRSRLAELGVESAQP
ncbi:MAG TPA: sigma-70 family RNA polymerase sigma factor [Gemmatimonadaceae bacterium]|nr:sigma-70 family RNA polymerase sigma factor [Gemmatimonadaceae bacterium]